MKTNIPVLFGFILTTLFMAVAPGTYAEEPLRVENFSPQGFVSDVRQVRVQFSAAAAPLGDLTSAPHPFDPVCKGTNVPVGSGRWADQQNWIYEFTADLPSGVKCTFYATQQFKTAHSNFTGEGEFSFDTSTATAKSLPDPCKPGGPLLTMQAPSGRGVDEEDESEAEEYGAWPLVNEQETYVLQSNCPVDLRSLQKSLWFEVQGLKDRVGVQLVEGTEREAALASRSLAGRENLLVVRPRQTFPADTEVALVWGSGIRSTSGFVRKEDQRVLYRVRPKFLVSHKCSHTFADGSCDPFLPIYAVFTESVPNWADGEYQFPDPVVLKGPEGAEWHGKSSYFREHDRDFPAVEFAPPFPPKQILNLVVPEQLKDRSDRTLENKAALPLKVMTGKIPPMVRFSSIFGIVESKSGGALPVTIRSIDSELTVQAGSNVDLVHGVGSLNAAVTSTQNPSDVLKWLVEVQNRYENIEENLTSLFEAHGTSIAADIFTVKKPNGPEAFEVVGIPFKKPGFYVLEIASPSMGADLKGNGKTMYVPTTALVTNLALHVKLGKESSLAWVTALDSGAVVEGAEVSALDCSGKELFRGVSNQDGIVQIPRIEGYEKVRCGLEQKYVQPTGVATAPVSDGALVVAAKKGDDFTFVLSTWDEGIENWRFGMPQEYWGSSSSISQTIFDRTLFRRGETVHMKHLQRIKTTKGFELVQTVDRPSGAEIWHVGSGEKYDLSLQWKENGSAENEWEIPSEAKLGDYNIYFKRPDGTTDYRYTGAFSVLDYRVPLMRAVIVPPKDEVLVPPRIPIDVSVRYLAGGGASGLPIKVRYQVQPWYVTFGGKFEGFNFSSEIDIPREYEEGEEGAPRASVSIVKSISANLDQTGSLRIPLDDVPLISKPSKLLTELEFKDPNGEIQTVASLIPMLPSTYLVGIQTDSWAQMKSGFKFSVAVVNAQGEGVPSVPVSVKLYQREIYTHRKKIIGGSFIYENQLDDTDRGAICAGVSDAHGLVSCESKVQFAGNFILEASAKDGEGNRSSVASSVYVGEDEFWFAQENTDRMDLLPEKREYEPGDIAKFQVRMPFKHATALVTVEREGIVDAFVRQIDRSNPIIELPIKSNYGPNVFVSALVVRGRIDEARPTAMFDPGKPAFRLGLAQIRVGWRGYTLKVGVKADKEVYKVREKVPVHLTVRGADGSLPPAGTELVVAAVDEGLLELKANDSWKILEAMMSMRALAVRTLTAQMFVIGKRHFGLKALPFGGGGGKSTTRELFDTLLYWNPSVPLNAQGEATVSVPLNDSLSSFKIVGVALGGAGMFGTGTTSIRATKDFMLFAGLPPLVRNGDSYTAEITARNTTDSTAKVQVTLKENETAGSGFAPQEVELGAGESKVVAWPVVAPLEGDSVSYAVALSKGGVVEDSLKASQVLVKPVPVSVLQGTLQQLKGPQRIPVQIPKNAVPERGGVRVTFSSSLGEDLGALQEYMRAYPFGCLEQRTSKAISLQDEELWAKIADDLPSYLDRDGFAKYFPSEEYGSETLTSYLLAVAKEAELEIPDAPRQRMIDALKRFTAGKLRTRSYRYLNEYYAEIGYKAKKLSPAELDLLTKKITALEALSRYGEGDPALISGLWGDPNQLPTSAVVNLLSIAIRMPDLSEQPNRLRGLEQIIRARLNFAGTTIRFAGEAEEAFFWDMISADVTAIRFMSVVLSDDGLYKRFYQDIGRLMRGMLDRQRNGRWDLTLANAWGALALESAKNRLSPVPVQGKSIAALEGQRFEFAWDDTKGASLLPWPKNAATLELAHEGTGAPWVTVHSLAAVPRTEPVSAGYVVTKKFEAVQQKTAGEYHVGDVIRVTVPFTSAGNKTWIVVDDPVPASATILGSGLGRDSSLLTQGGADNYSWVYPAFEERSFQGYRAYFREVPKGDFSVQYVMRFNTAGEFALPATRVEAMYAPEIFGEYPNGKVTVLP